MKAFLETTVWDDGKEFPHVYWMDDSKNRAYAYARFGNPDDVQLFKKPIQLDVRGRTFATVRNIFNFVDHTAPKAETWTIEGSRGDKYVVEQTENGLSCTCSGFKFRGDCKHVNQINLATA